MSHSSIHTHSQTYMAATSVELVYQWMFMMNKTDCNSAVDKFIFTVYSEAKAFSIFNLNAEKQTYGVTKTTLCMQNIAFLLLQPFRQALHFLLPVAKVQVLFLYVVFFLGFSKGYWGEKVSRFNMSETEAIWLMIADDCSSRHVKLFGICLEKWKMMFSMQTATFFPALCVKHNKLTFITTI